MKQLILMRHAKTEAAMAGADDYIRILTDRGVDDAQKAATALMNYGIPEALLVSGAARTQQTAQILEEVWNVEGLQIITDDLYLASPDDMLSVIQSLDNTVNNVCVVGHNPGMHMLAHVMAEKGPKEGLQRLQSHFPTSAFAVLQCPWERWVDAKASGAKLIYFYDRQH